MEDMLHTLTYRQAHATSENPMERPTLYCKLFTLQEIASFLRVNRSSVSRLLKNGDLPYIPVGGRKLVCESDLARFIDNHRVSKNDDCACRNGA